MLNLRQRKNRELSLYFSRVVWIINIFTFLKYFLFLSQDFSLKTIIYLRIDGYEKSYYSRGKFFQKKKKEK